MSHRYSKQALALNEILAQNLLNSEWPFLVTSNPVHFERQSCAITVCFHDPNHDGAE